MRKLIREVKEFMIPEWLLGEGEMVEDNSEEVIKGSKELTLEEKKELLLANERRKSAEWGYIREQVKELVQERQEGREEVRYRDGGIHDTKARLYRVDEELKGIVLLLHQMGYSQPAIYSAMDNQVGEATIGKYTLDLGVDMEAKGYTYTRSIVVELLDSFLELDIKQWRVESYQIYTSHKFTGDEEKRVRQLWNQGKTVEEAAILMARGKKGIKTRYKRFWEAEVQEGCEYYAES